MRNSPGLSELILFILFKTFLNITDLQHWLSLLHVYPMAPKRYCGSDPVPVSLILNYRWGSANQQRRFRWRGRSLCRLPACQCKPCQDELVFIHSRASNQQSWFPATNIYWGWVQKRPKPWSFRSINRVAIVSLGGGAKQRRVQNLCQTRGDHRIELLQNCIKVLEGNYGQNSPCHMWSPA